MPTLRDYSILVKVGSVAMNPTDWENALRSQPGVTVGCDYAGIVEAIGPAVKKPCRVGDLASVRRSLRRVYSGEGGYGSWKA
ncbi:uncharacterized protein LDX57_008537 [Aspergillus melleus]|uniref:uncharacterized protein n=1 Tax=Aspergillus melleus TaxID=138277 RepID=UPI001E8D3BD5|nr:uncharacterized protein LDX57_008537 [Aspergillus melleus]KAH8430873.1 hypothetical protein LDX57_008537 [Aspergillus melleus]